MVLGLKKIQERACDTCAMHGQYIEKSERNIDTPLLPLENGKICRISPRTVHLGYIAVEEKWCWNQKERPVARFLAHPI
jgi:hypothetical protein